MADSAGTPWAGRTLRPNPFSGDDGRADPALRSALEAVAAAPLDPAAHTGVLTALRAARLYAPVLPTAVEHVSDERGFVHDNRSEMAMVRLAAEDGREATPCFTDIPALTAWADAARPVPIEAERMAAAAIEEGAQLLVLDPGTAHTFVVRRPALWAFIQGRAWTPAWADEAVARACARATAGLDWIDAAGVGPGTAQVGTAGPEVALTLTCSRQPSAAELGVVQERLSANEVLAERADSLTLSLRA
ncbi:SseB family protein [Brevibacterium sp. 5221]|uniref:SseB family protein n=1 Tax=Brevibacterium rongguiense TaxID=2695267 RepID=A0A6N9H6U0_9MICO|nr:SseB family protein [Brevibacterium rongguiense]